MNGDVVALVAWTQEQGARAKENEILNAFADELAEARRENRIGTDVTTPESCVERHRACATAMNKAIARVAARCAGAGVR